MPHRPIQLYFWPTPNGKKITIALEEMGLPYHIVPVDIGAGDQHKPAFLAISPNNKMPAIVDPDGPGAPVSVFESGAILQYLGRKTGAFYPSDERARIEVEQWLHWQMGGLGPMAGQANHFRIFASKTEPDPEKLRYGVERFADSLPEASRPPTMTGIARPSGTNSLISRDRSPLRSRKGGIRIRNTSKR